MKKVMFSWWSSIELFNEWKIVKSKIFDEVFVQPASGDAGLAIGAAINCSLEFQQKKSYRLKPIVILDQDIQILK